MRTQVFYHPKLILILILITVALTLFFGAEASACPDPTITPVNLNGDDYRTGGVISGTPSGTLDLCGILSRNGIQSDTEIRLSIELSNGATFGAAPSLTVTGGLQWDLFAGGFSGDASVTWDTTTGNNTLPPNQIFTVDISSINVQGPDDGQVTIAPTIYDHFGATNLPTVTATYIDFSPVVFDTDGDGIEDSQDADYNPCLWLKRACGRPSC